MDPQLKAAVSLDESSWARKGGGWNEITEQYGISTGEPRAAVQHLQKATIAAPDLLAKRREFGFFLQLSFWPGGPMV